MPLKYALLLLLQGQLNSIAPNHDGYYGNQPNMHQMVQHDSGLEYLFIVHLNFGLI